MRLLTTGGGHAWRPAFPATRGRRDVRPPTTVASSVLRCPAAESHHAVNGSGRPESDACAASVSPWEPSTPTGRFRGSGYTSTATRSGLPHDSHHFEVAAAAVALAAVDGHSCAGEVPVDTSRPAVAGGYRKAASNTVR